MYKIIFNRNTNAYADKDDEVNLMFIKLNESYVNDLFKIRGYMYIQEIYTYLGAKWNPDWANVCFIYNESDFNRIVFNICSVDDGFEITIG